MNRPIQLPQAPASVQVPPAADTSSAVLHQPFAWHDIQIGVQTLTRPAEAAEFAGEVRDIAKGVSDLLGILEKDDLDSMSADEEGQPLPRLLSVNLTDNLQRLCIASLNLLSAAAQRRIEEAQQCAKRGES